MNGAATTHSNGTGSSPQAAAFTPTGPEERGSKRKWRRDLVIAVSFANLCVLDIWDKTISQWNAAFSGYPPRLLHVIGAPVVTVLLIAAVIYAVLYIVRRLGRAWVLAAKALALVTLCALPLNILRMDVFTVTWTRVTNSWGYAGLIVICVAGSAAIIIASRYPARLLAAPAFFSILFAPLFPIQLCLALWSSRYLMSDTPFEDKRRAPLMEHNREKPRIIWLLFDEMDSCLSFAERPVSLAMPELDRFARESIRVDQGVPASANTETAIPGLLTGRPVERVTWLRPDRPRLVFRGANTPVDWKGQENIFFEMRRTAGLNAAVVGWFFPYCRVLDDSLASCWWQSAGFMEHQSNRNRPLLQQVSMNLRSRIYRLPMMLRVMGTDTNRHSIANLHHGMRERQMAEYVRVRSMAQDVLTDTRFDVIFIHWPIPHLPGIYSREKRQLSVDGTNHYLDNLALVDVTLGYVRRTLEAAGHWDKTIVLLSADHPLRKPEVNFDFDNAMSLWTQRDLAAVGSQPCSYVPFLLKAANQKKGIAIDTPFRTILIHQLLLTLGQGQLRSPESVAAWIQQHACRDCSLSQ